MLCWSKFNSVIFECLLQKFLIYHEKSCNQCNICKTRFETRVNIFTFPELFPTPRFAQWLFPVFSFSTIFSQNCYVWFCSFIISYIFKKSCLYSKSGNIFICRVIFIFVATNFQRVIYQIHNIWFVFHFFKKCYF